MPPLACCIARHRQSVRWRTHGQAGKDCSFSAPTANDPVCHRDSDLRDSEHPGREPRTQGSLTRDRRPRSTPEPAFSCHLPEKIARFKSDSDCSVHGPGYLAHHHDRHLRDASRPAAWSSRRHAPPMPAVCSGGRVAHAHRFPLPIDACAGGFSIPSARQPTHTRAAVAVRLPCGAVAARRER